MIQSPQKTDESDDSAHVKDKDIKSKMNRNLKKGEIF